MTGYRKDNYSERAMQILEKDIYYLAHNNWGYGMDPQDVAQELRIHLWEKLDKYHPKKSELRTWAQTVMRNRLVSLYRKTEYGRNTGIPRNLLDSRLREFYEDLGDKEIAEEWDYEEIIITTFQELA